MRTSSKLIERYIIRAITPYLFLSLLLLTAILFTQQASRFGELLMGTRVPLGTVTQLALSLLPNVLVFTLPMALLTGILIGFSRMGSDSELTAMRAAGVGTWRMLWPALLIGVLLTLTSLYVNLKLAPESARALRRAGIYAALYKLDSPVEPRSFNTDIPGKVIYIRNGDKSQGLWENVFLYSKTPNGSALVVTARSGRIDSAGAQSELVLSDAVLLTLPENTSNNQGEYVTEHLEQLRIVLETGRKEILYKLQEGESEPKPNEMNWGELSQYAGSRTGLEWREANTLRHKRFAMSLTPLVFALLGATLGLRVRKGGRGVGVLLSLLTMLSYYLITLAGEQMARAGTLPPFVGAWMASVSTIICALVLLATGRLSLLGKVKNTWDYGRSVIITITHRKQEKIIGKARLLNFPSLMDLDVLRAATLSFTIAFVSLVAVFLVFTLFELWRFIAAKGISMWTVGEYLLFLLPLVSVQLLPASVLISVLVAYALMSRRSEAIAWWASGQSVYRLMLPGLIFAAFLGCCLWLVQERLMPWANIRQDALRVQIRGEVSRATGSFNRQWLASSESGRLYSYEYEEPNSLRNPVMYEFDDMRIHLLRIIKGQDANWISYDRLNIRNAESLTLTKAGIERGEQVQTEIANVEPIEVFKPTSDKPSHLSAEVLSNYIKTVDRRGGDVMPLTVALYKKYADPFNTLVIALAGIPLALSFGRKSTIMALCLAIALGLIFWAASEGFRQLGEYGLLPPIVAAWSPAVIFTAIGIYLLARAQT
jgi:LPS export ABC transporter permease LptF/LPS export ABC transporter permease LptG